MATIIEPFRIKVVEPLRMTTRAERTGVLTEAHWNLFNVPARDVLIDLLTDSGTAAMSTAQWAAIFQGDESYAGADSFFRFHDAVRNLTHYEHIIPTHQGRAAERILFESLLEPGDVVPNNTHFDTTRANIEHVGATALDLPCAEASDLTSDAPFKGNIDLQKLETLLDSAARVPLIMMTATNNAVGGQPVSLANLRAVSDIARRRGIPLYLDAARFAENAFLITQRETGLGDRSAASIAAEMFALCDGCTMSAKKDGLANTGGFVATNAAPLAARMRELLILTEGFTTYGGMAGRDMEAVAVGLREVLDVDYLTYRIASTRYLGMHLMEHGVPIMRPTGGHAVYLDAKAFLPHIPATQYPGQALVAGLYLEGGIRAVEIGSVMFGGVDAATGKERHTDRELVRLAIPRRVYTQSHMDYVVDVIAAVFARRHEISGLSITWQPASLRHFSAQFAPVAL